MTTIWRARPRNVRTAAPALASAPFLQTQGFGPTALPVVNEAQVRGLPAYWRCLNFVGNGVASLMTSACVVGTDGFTELDVPPVVARPWPALGATEYWHMAQCVAMGRGNFVAILADFDVDGYPRQAVPVPVECIDSAYLRAGIPLYPIAGLERPLGPDEVVHVRGLVTPGSLWGVGVVDNFRRSLGAALEIQHMSADTYNRASVPSGIIEVPVPDPSPKQTEDVQTQWVERHGGGSRRPAVLPQGWKFTPIAWTPEEAQFLQSRQMSIAETALMCGLDPKDIGATIGGSNLLYANVEQQEIGRVIDSYGPWTSRFAEAWSDLIPGNSRVRYNTSARLALDAKTEAEVHKTNIESGVETVPEARKATGKSPKPAPGMDNPKPPAPPAPPTTVVNNNGGGINGTPVSNNNEVYAQ